MAQHVNTDCLRTTVKNTSGSTRHFGFLGPGHKGKTLAANETYTQPGDLAATLGAMRDQRRFEALERCVKSGALDIVKSPGVFLFDETNDRTQVLALKGGDLGKVDPCFYTDGSSTFVDDDDT